MDSINADELRRFYELYRAAETRSLHYHDKMWEAARSFGTLISILLSASFLLMTSSPSPLNVIGAIATSITAAYVAVRGKRVLMQMRELFAYELAVRRKIELALGWKLSYPEIRKLLGWRRSTQAPPAEFEYLEIDHDEAKKAREEMLWLTPAESKAIHDKVKGRAGVYGVVMRLLTYAAWAASLLVCLYAYWWWKRS